VKLHVEEKVRSTCRSLPATIRRFANAKRSLGSRDFAPRFLSRYNYIRRFWHSDIRFWDTLYIDQLDSKGSTSVCVRAREPHVSILCVGIINIGSPSRVVSAPFNLTLTQTRARTPVWTSLGIVGRAGDDPAAFSCQKWRHRLRNNALVRSVPLPLEFTVYLRWL